MFPMLSGLFIKGDNGWVVLAHKTISVPLNSPICVRPGLKPRELRGFLYSRTCINKHNVLQLSSKFVFIIFNENGNQQHLKYLSFLLFSL